MPGSGETSPTDQGTFASTWSDVGFPNPHWHPDGSPVLDSTPPIPQVSDWRASLDVRQRPAVAERVAVGCVAIALLGWFLAFARLALTTGSFGFILVGILALVGVFLLPALLETLPRQRVSKADEALCSELEEGDALVEVAIYQEGILTGRDRGIAWVEDEGLAFSGHQCSFLIGGQDIDEPYNLAAPTEREHRFWLRHPSRSLSVRFRILDMPGQSPRRSESFREHLYNWQRGRPVTRLERMYPPLALHPNVRLRARVPWLFLAGIFGVTLLVVSLARGSGLFFFWLPFSGLAGGFGMREKRRLEAQLRSEGRFHE